MKKHKTCHEKTNKIWLPQKDDGISMDLFAKYLPLVAIRQHVLTAMGSLMAGFWIRQTWGANLK